MHQLLNLPDWLPWWIPLVLLLPTSLWALSFLFMPFSVFGLKTRLDLLDARLDEIQQEIRHLAHYMPSGVVTASDFDDVYTPRTGQTQPQDRVVARPPIPPSRHELYSAPVRSAATGPVPAPEMEDRPPPQPNARPVRRAEPVAQGAMRAEPRLDWRR
jgi:hypothetical protein